MLSAGFSAPQWPQNFLAVLGSLGGGVLVIGVDVGNVNDVLGRLGLGRGLGLGGLVVALHALADALDRLAEGLAELREVLRAKDHENDDQDDDELRGTQSKKHINSSPDRHSVVFASCGRPPRGTPVQL